MRTQYLYLFQDDITKLISSCNFLFIHDSFKYYLYHDIKLKRKYTQIYANYNITKQK